MPIARGIFLLLIVPIALLSPHAFYWTDHGEIWLALKWLLIPFSLAAWLGLRRFPLRRRPYRRGELLGGALALGALMSMLATGPMLVANAMTADAERVIFEGKVVEKIPPSSKSNAIIVFVDAGGARHRWPVRREVLEEVDIGGRFRLAARAGGLGILYVHPDEKYWEVLR